MVVIAQLRRADVCVLLQRQGFPCTWLKAGRHRCSADHAHPLPHHTLHRAAGMINSFYCRSHPRDALPPPLSRPAEPLMERQRAGRRRQLEADKVSPQSSRTFELNSKTFRSRRKQVHGERSPATRTERRGRDAETQLKLICKQEKNRKKEMLTGDLWHICGAFNVPSEKEIKSQYAVYMTEKYHGSLLL